MGSIEIAAITRVQDFTTIKQNEDNRGAIMQTTMNHQSEKDIQTRASQVVQKEEADWQQKKFDAKDKGSNEYSNDSNHGSRGKKRQDRVIEQVVIKGQQGFDIKI